MSAVEKVTNAEVIDFDEAAARKELKDLTEAMKSWVMSTTELADHAYRAKKLQCWKVDDDYRAALSTGAIAPVDDGHGQTKHADTWLSWKFNRAARTVRGFVDYGELLAIIAVDPALPQLAEPEFVVRPMADLLRPKYLSKGEKRDDAARDEAIRDIWRKSLAKADAEPVAALGFIKKVAKDSDFKPIKRKVTPTPGDRTRAKEAKIAMAEKKLRDGAQTLIDEKQFIHLKSVLDEILAELKSMETMISWT